MPKLDTFTLEIKTGARPGPEKPIFNITGFPLEFEALCLTGGEDLERGVAGQLAQALQQADGDGSQIIIRGRPPRESRAVR